MLNNFSNGVSADRSLFDELTAQMVQFRMTFESHMSKLASFNNDESSVMMAEAIETVDKMNSVLEQYHQVCHLLV